MNGISHAVVMAICPKELVRVPAHLQECFWQVDSGRQAIEIMRMSNIDVLLVSMDLPDIDTWELVRRVRDLHLSVKWALLCRDISPEQEVRARTLGVLIIFHTMPDVGELYELAVLVREKAKAAVGYNKYAYSVLGAQTRN